MIENLVYGPSTNDYAESNNSSHSRPSHESPTKRRSQDEQTRSHRNDPDESEQPLLKLLATSHPWVGDTINSSLSAYSTTKQNSPGIIQYGADFIERNIGSPLASTVGSVGRRTGVEGSIRRYLDSRRPSELERIDPEILVDDGSSKRRRIATMEDSEMETDHDIPRQVDRRMTDQSSVDTLPTYDENRSPAYEERSIIESSTSRLPQRPFRPAANRSWSTQLMIHTSGLGAALNEASLRSLKYCLQILRGANLRVRELMEALKRLLSTVERTPDSERLSENNESQNTAKKSAATHVENVTSDTMILDHDSLPQPPADDLATGETITKRIQDLNNEIWQTLKSVVSNVSRYTGGALPESASGFVKWQLMSVPQRWQRAVSISAPAQVNGSAQQPNTKAGPDNDAGDVVGSAHRMLAFAIEGIDMMNQVGGVVDQTIVSAESWLEKMGRAPQGHVEQREGEQENEHAMEWTAGPSMTRGFVPVVAPEQRQSQPVTAQDR